MEIKTAEDLKAAILELEDRKHRQKQQFVENFHAFTESLTPINLIKSTFNKVRESPGLPGSVVKAGVGLGMGLLTKRLLIGDSAGFFKKIIGSAIKMGVAGLVAKKSDAIQSTGVRFLKNLFRKKKRDLVM